MTALANALIFAGAFAARAAVIAVADAAWPGVRVVWRMAWRIVS